MGEHLNLLAADGRNLDGYRAAATRLDGLACSVGYYGGGIGGLVDEKPRCPVMLHFGDQDQSIPMEVVDKVRKAHPDLPLYDYHAGHGFNCVERGSL